MSPLLQNIILGASSVRLSFGDSARYSLERSRRIAAQAMETAREEGVSADAVLKRQLFQRVLGQIGYFAVSAGLLCTTIYGVTQGWAQLTLVALGVSPAVLHVAAAVAARRIAQ